MMKYKVKSSTLLEITSDKSFQVIFSLFLGIIAMFFSLAVLNPSLELHLLFMIVVFFVASVFVFLSLQAFLLFLEKEEN